MTTDFAGHAGASAVVVQDGKLVAAGFGLVGSGVDFALARYHRNGTLDRTFGMGGKVTTDFAGGEDRAEALVVQGGKLVAGRVHDHRVRTPEVRPGPLQRVVTPPPYLGR